MLSVKNPKDFYAGVLLLCVVAVYALGLLDLRIGSLSRPGPGYFPLILTSLLFVFAVAILINGLRTKGEPIGAVPWRAMFFVTAPVIFFGATVKGLGFVPSLAITAIATCMGSTQWTWKSALLTALVLVFFSYIVFIWGLGLPVALCGSWLRSLFLSVGVPATSLNLCY
ncbi:MAG: tripartite tricarboxylate transporter TctB family protein [Rhizobiales bacterium]|jgi:hypothetical protein|nr:tripartite tricarboxylate transporter TctB family protein [Hyphomicrobiales bacterium]